MMCERCMKCPALNGDVWLSMTSYEDRLSFFVNGRNIGRRCLFKTDMKSLLEVVPVDMRAEWHKMPGWMQLDRLKEHVVEVVEPDDGCPFMADVLIETWNR